MLKKISLIFSSYTNVIVALIVFTTFSGALRKWAGFPTMINNLFILIMIVSPACLLFFFKTSKTIEINKSIRPILQVFVFVLVILAVHPFNKTYFHGIFGFFLYLTVAGLFISYFKNRADFDISKISKIFLYLLVSQIILATIQYASPADSIINIYADNTQQNFDETQETINDAEEAPEVGIALVGDAVRVTGTFSYLGGYTAFLFFCLLFTFYLTKSKSIKYFFIFSPIIVYGSLLSGARASVGFCLILIAVFMISERKLFSQNIKIAFNSIAGILIFLTINLALGDFIGVVEKIEVAYDNFMSRVEDSKEESKGRLTGDLKEAFFRDFDYRYTGVGLGATYQGATALFGTSDIVSKTPMEGELFRIVIEGGIFLLLFKWIFLVIIFSFLDIPILLKICFFICFYVFSYTTFNIFNAIYISLGIICLNEAYQKRLNAQ